jgi:hypothetical protein
VVSLEREVSGKISERLQEVVNRGSVSDVPVKIRLKADLTPRRLLSTLKKIGSHVSDVEHLAISGTVHGRLALSGVTFVSGVPDVEWIDLEGEVPIEELIDPG